MSQDPKTRHLSRDELARALAEAERPSLDGSPLEPKTTVWQRPAPLSVSREPATQLEVQVHRRVQSHSEESKVDTDKLSQQRPIQTVITRVGIGLLVASCAWWVGLRPMPPSNVSAKSQAAAVIAQPATTVEVAPKEVVPAPRALDVPAPSQRAAVDLLLAGHEREALDAYRALALHQPAEPSFAQIVSLLERELSACEKEPATCVR